MKRTYIQFIICDQQRLSLQANNYAIINHLLNGAHVFSPDIKSIIKTLEFKYTDNDGDKKIFF